MTWTDEMLSVIGKVFRDLGHLLSLLESSSVSWACTGTSQAPVVRAQCDGWLVVDGRPVLQFWRAIE